MLISRRQFHALSRDPATLIRAILVILGVFILIALWLGYVRPPDKPEVQESLSQKRAKDLNKVLKASPLDRAALLRALRVDAQLARHLTADPDPEETGDGLPPGPGIPRIPKRTLPPEVSFNAFQLEPLLAGSSLTPVEQKGILTWYEAVLSQKTTPEQITQLAALAMPAAPDLPGTMAADLKRIAQDYEGALADYEAIGAQPQALEARRRAVDLTVTREWDAVTARLLSQKAYDDAVHAFPDDLADHVARGQLDVGRLLHHILRDSLKGLQQFDYLFLSLLVGAVWFISLHKASRIPRRLWWISLAAIPLGMLSTVITLVLGELQEARHGLSVTGQVGPDFVFWIASVGLREEVSKMICVLPLLLLLRKGTPAQALMAASCVGLGFAVEENINYLAGSHGTDLLGRFITANFLHVAMTGLIGHALFRFLRYPKNFGNAFLATFVGMVVLHGVYDFSLTYYDNPLSRELSHLTPFFVAGLAFYYFQTIRQDMDDAPQALSAQAVFLLGTATAVGTLLNFLVWQEGWGDALQAIVGSILSSVLFCWLFVYHLRNT